jgi:hypothetical protein
MPLSTCRALPRSDHDELLSGDRLIATALHYLGDKNGARDHAGRLGLRLATQSA